MSHPRLVGKPGDSCAHTPTVFLVKQRHLVDMQCQCSAEAATFVVGGVHRL